MVCTVYFGIASFDQPVIFYSHCLKMITKSECTLLFFYGRRGIMNVRAPTPSTKRMVFQISISIMYFD